MSSSSTFGTGLAGNLGMFYWELQDGGVSVVANGEDTNEELILFIKAGIAGAESRRTLERVRANMSKAIGKGV